MSNPAAPTIAFNRPARTGREAAHIQAALERGYLTAGPYVARCQAWLEATLAVPAVFMTPSCTHALEMAAVLLDLKPGDEVILPSFTFVSSANAFALHGATPVFVDIDPATLGLTAALVEAAITPRTRAIVAVHYGGFACDIAAIRALADARGLTLIEDAAHGLQSTFAGHTLGSFGHIATISFHETKHLTSGEGGCLILHDPAHIDRADILRFKGTNRTAFQRGKVSAYRWVDVGSSWNMGELAAAYLWGNFQDADTILSRRLALWNRYDRALAPLARAQGIQTPTTMTASTHNAAVYYLLMQSEAARSRFINAMREKAIECVMHYIPLHSSPAGERLGRFHGEDIHTTRVSKSLVRLPLYYNLSDADAERVIAATIATIKADT